ncbi:hypothetical protein [Scytonema hofmannii]|uniref:hypothetical protein n=1 Tax=Scytonema hofmannii TaxID=34078 RepID=UPI00300FC900
MFFEIDLIVSSSFDLPVNAMFDTGFSGYLAINGQDIDGFGWTYIKQQPMFTARGETEFDLYLGEVRACWSRISDSRACWLLFNRSFTWSPMAYN